MVRSPSSSPPSRWNSQQRDAAQGGGQLLQELEALSQALYQAQRKSTPLQTYQAQGQPAASPKKHFFLPKRESLPGRRFSSYDPSKDASYRSDPIPLPGLASHDPPPSFTNFLSRHSMSPQVPAPPELKSTSVNSRPRLSSSTIPSQATPTWSEEKSDIRARERRLSLQPLQARSMERFTSEEPEWHEESAEISRKVESSAEKKKSMWNWKPFRALSHIGRQRYHCVFSAYVHAIEGLPPAMNGLRLCVHMRKEETKEGAVQTMPSRVFQGIAEFQETLFMKCTLYGSKGPSNGMKFMAKAFIVSVIAPDIDELDFGKHQLDLNRLLTDFMDDRRGQLEKGNSWDTTLDLYGKAKGGKLVVTFNYEIFDKDTPNFGNSSTRFRDSPPQRSSFHTSYSLPNSAHGTPRTMPARAHLSHSPTVSEPGIDYEDLSAMEHLSLDEPAPSAGASDVIGGGETSQLQGFPAIRSHFERSFAQQHVYNTFTNAELERKDFNQSEQGLAPSIPIDSVEQGGSDSSGRQIYPENREEDAPLEEDADFVVVDQGVEVDDSVEHSVNDDEVIEKQIDTVKRESLNDLKPDADRDLEEKELEGKEEFQVEELLYNELEKEKEVDADRLNGTNSLDVPDRNISETLKIEEETEKIVNVDEGEKKEVDVGGKKETVTYQMVLQTLDSLLEGTSAKEEPQEAILHEDVLTKTAVGDIGEYLDHNQVNTINNGELIPDGSELIPDGSELMPDGSELNGDVGENVVKQHTAEPEAEESAELDAANAFLEHQTEDDNAESEADLVAGEFLNLLEFDDKLSGKQSDSEPDSPRARLLKQFEQEALLDGGFGLDLEDPQFLPDDTVDATIAHNYVSEPDLGNSGTSNLENKSSQDWYDREDSREHNFFMEAAEVELQRATQSLRSKTRAKMLEDAETEALMQEWGLNEKAFATSPPKPTFKTQESPPLGRGLGTSVPLKDGGSLRSMNPSHFQSNKSSGKLIMQVSKPLVVPAEMGSETVDILRNMASMGVENMALQVMTAMPLEDISGQSIEQVAMEGKTTNDFKNGRALDGSFASKREISRADGKYGRHLGTITDEFVSLEDLAPMAMQQIEALAIDGLKIQSDMTEDDAPFALNAFSVDVPSESTAEAGMGAVKGVTGVHLMKGVKVPAETSGSSHGLMDMAITLDEWILLDAGLYDESQTQKDTMAIMAAHHAAHQELVPVTDEDKKKRKNSGRTGWGCMGNTLTIAMLVQLRDPLRNNEAIGAPMMAFVQAERMVKPPKPKVGRTVSIKGNSEDEEADSQLEQQFKITSVHMAGLKDSQEDQKVGWGSQKQLQTGSRWLIANGMSKNSRNHPLLTSKSTSSSLGGKAKEKQSGSLWSISSRLQNASSRWKDSSKLRPHVRNPDVVYEPQALRVK